jgi:PAS domain-containing protein/DNA-binding CsgD family transcriptional regulator
MTVARTPASTKEMGEPKGRVSTRGRGAQPADYDRLPLPCMLIDRRGRLAHVNRPWIEMFGTPLRKAIGKPFEGFLEPDWVPHFRANLTSLLHTGRLEGLQLEVLRKDGPPALVELFARFDEGSSDSGRFAHCVLYHSPVHGRAEEVLTQGLLHERIIAEISCMAIEIKEFEPFCESCTHYLAGQTSADAVYLFGFDSIRDKVRVITEWVGPLGKSIKGKYQDYPASTFPWFMEQIKSNNPICYSDIRDIPWSHQEYQTFSHAGVKSLLHLPLSAKGELHGFIGFETYGQHREWMRADVWILEIASRIIVSRILMNQAEMRLRESERLLSNTFDAIQDGIVIMDKEMNLVRMNRTASDWFPNAASGHGRKCYAFFHGRDDPCPVCPSKRALETGQVCVEIEPIDNPARVDEWIELFAFPIPGEDGKPAGVIEYLKEVTARVRAERALKESHHMLEQRVRERTLKLQSSFRALKTKHQALVRHKKELAQLNQELSQTNLALATVTRLAERSRIESESKSARLIHSKVVPLLSSLKQGGSLEMVRMGLDALNAYITQVGPGLDEEARLVAKLTPQQIKLALLIRNGVTAREAGVKLGISPETVRTHRKRIRKALGLQDSKTNLATYLKSVLKVTLPL